ncbi:DUF2895 family protein [Mesorhizobium yinganensis]|uniref:DUF2895 family protein n=1 Tax=Mesorhizobium yinganensis TaxID=3157707 RepID=UPI003CCD9AF0
MPRFLTLFGNSWKRDTVRRDYDYRRSLGELRQRVRGIYEIPGCGYGEDRRCA